MASTRSRSTKPAKTARRPAKRKATKATKPAPAAAAGKPKAAMGINRIVVTDGKINAKLPR